MISRVWSHLLIATPIAAALLLGAVSVGFYLKFFPTHFRGAAEITDQHKIAGWVVNESAPKERVEVQLYIDGRFVAGQTANLSRPDVVAAGRAVDEWCGYSFEMPALDAGEHEARVFAVHTVGDGAYRTLQLVVTPMRFKIDVGDGADAPVRLFWHQKQR
ncbi:MAG TPA: hypothetical protein VD966_00655 [Pyrinomonadaceae bacterium]|nr:hypothetical protein [Pyrinomonadaceae bacterium]